jgi:lipopolysaccharide export system protein LptC
MAIDLKKLSLREIGPDNSRLSLLSSGKSAHNAVYHELYSKFVRFMRLFIPLVAVGIIGIVMAWPNVDNSFAPIPKEAVAPQTIGKNELLNPRFESEDDRKQPFTITALKAVQSSTDSDVITLEKPMADITLKNKAWLSAEALQGTYRQNDERLVLKGSVRLFHDHGYEMKTEELVIDLKTNKAWSTTPVYGQGPSGTLRANKGMSVDLNEGKLIFNGRVNLVLNRNIEGL